MKPNQGLKWNCTPQTNTQMTSNDCIHSKKRKQPDVGVLTAL
jgi:hypothetical protein